MNPIVPANDKDDATRRAAARRTALIVAAIAFAVYAGFIALNYLAVQG